MENFSFGGGGRKRRDFIGGRPKSDANYGLKKKGFDRKPGFRGSNDRPKHQGDRELFATQCTTCGKACEVPFRPDGSKPVLCRDCFAKNNPPERGDFKSPRQDFSRSGGHDDRNFRRPERRDHAPMSTSHDTTHYVALTKQVAALETKLNEIISLLGSTHTTQAIADTSPTEADTTSRGNEKNTPTSKVTKKITKKVTTAKKSTKKTARRPAKKATKAKKVK